MFNADAAICQPSFQRQAHLMPPTKRLRPPNSGADFTRLFQRPPGNRHFVGLLPDSEGLNRGKSWNNLAISFASRVVVEHRNQQPEISISIGLLARAGHMSDIDKARNLGFAFSHLPVAFRNAANLSATTFRSIFEPCRLTSQTAYVPVSSFSARMSSSFSPFRSHQPPMRVHCPDSAS